MAAYNKLNGPWCTANRYLLTDVLRDQWKFKGIMMSDWGAVHEGLGPLKAGTDLIWSTYSELDVRNVRGDFRFRGRGTNVVNGTSSGFRSFADFLLGVADQTQRQIGAEPAHLRGWQLAAFVRHVV